VSHAKTTHDVPPPSEPGNRTMHFETDEKHLPSLMKASQSSGSPRSKELGVNLGPWGLDASEVNPASNDTSRSEVRW
jgi:hypothetical protein